MQGARKTPLFNLTWLDFQQLKKTIGLYQVFDKGCNHLLQQRRRVKIVCTELVTVDVVDVKTVSREVLLQMEIPEKSTQEPPRFAITTGVRLRSHTNHSSLNGFEMTWLVLAASASCTSIAPPLYHICLLGFENNWLYLKIKTVFPGMGQY